ncbi:multicopper oxidase family protein [Aquipuribacter nitratireducens]|uniref:Multicopper oxidase family protein n=1 Tax=Aquipuribacter nitratireducens TaxID=650104 RepID=A0ABW0GK91_9MICO
MPVDRSVLPPGAAVPVPSRRALLRAVVGGATGAVLLDPGRALATPAGAVPLREPEVRRSAGGVLDVTLRAARSAVPFGGARRTVMSYEGGVPGPTLVVAPGDVLRVRLVNDLPHPTNLHTHGLHVSGEGIADNVFRHVGPGETADYEIPLRPDHHEGTNWYHPHAHGHSAQQMFEGMAGALVVQRREETGRSTGISRDRVLVLSSTAFTADGAVADPFTTRQDAQVRLVNGQVRPTIGIAPGETQRWRLVNASVNHVFRLRLDGHRTTQVAADGVPFRRALDVDELLLAPGQRADLLVTGGAEGVVELRTLPVDIGFGVVLPAGPVATVACRGAAPAPGPLHAAALLRPFEDLRRRRVAVHREVAFTMAGGFGMDGRPFDPTRVDQTCELGTVEEWTVRNETGLVHPFHSHVNPFQVTHVDGVPVDARSYQDTVLVGKQGGTVTFRTHLQHFPGRAVYHCHFVTHAELGMMAVADVVDPRA